MSRPQRPRPTARPRTGSLARPIRDTGIVVGGGRRRAARGERSPYPALTAIALLVGLALIGSTFISGGSDAADPTLAAGAIPSVPGEPERKPTPRFAAVGSIDLRLPIDPASITALAFHQASGERALSITSLVPDADMALANELKSVPPRDADTVVPEDVWGGVCLRLWRSNRGGMPDTAVDVGADPGTDVYAPVTGTVIQVRSYLLYDAYEDFEIHIRPEGRDDADTVLIHVDDVSVEAGDRVKAGVTRIAAVRKVSDKIDIQLGGYTANGGDHVHVQINAIDAADELEPAGDS